MDGVHGHVGHAVQDVVMEQSNVVENVIVLYLPVEEMVVQGQVLKCNLLSHNKFKLTCSFRKAVSSNDLLERLHVHVFEN